MRSLTQLSEEGSLGCVQLDTIKPLPKSLRIDTFWQDIVYENVLMLCFHCGWIGHRESTCSKSSGGATQSLGCSWENLDLKKKKYIYIYIYIII